MLKRLLLIALFVVGSTVLYAQSSGTGSSGSSGSGSSGSTQGTQDQPGMSGSQGTQQDQPGSSSGSSGTTDQSGTSNTGSSNTGTSNTGSGGSTGTTDQNTATKMVTGKISKIDKDSNTITIKDDTTKEEQQFTLSSSATMTKDGSSITQSQLKKGDRVNVEVDGQNNVTKIDVMSKSSSSKSGDDKH